jgi:hypothetical protein
LFGISREKGAKLLGKMAESEGESRMQGPYTRLYIAFLLGKTRD